MARNHFLAFLGILIFLSPFLGLPYTYLAWAVSILGVLITITALLKGKQKKEEVVSLHGSQTHAP